MQMMKLLFTVIFALQVCHLVKALVQNDSFERRISKEVASSSATVPILPKAPRTNDSRNLKRTDGISKRVVASKVSLPENIPRLSDLLKESSLNDFSKTPGASMTKTRKETTLRKQNNIFAPSKQIFNSESSAPWKAGFKASIRTQGRIKKEFKSFSPGTLPSQRAKNILKALLSTPPRQCNAANVVCALTYSAKSLGTHRILHPDGELRSMLFQTLDVLHDLVKERLLNTRQLCNACWAIAKHYDRDDAILPPQPEAVALSSESVRGRAETWDVKEHDCTSHQARQDRVDETVNEIANQLTKILEQSGEDNDGDAALPAKIGEICMVSWAYGKLRPRRTPPGWQEPPQLGKLPGANNEADKFMVTSNLIKFEKWSSFRNKEETRENFSESEHITDKLFDAIGVSLCSAPESLSFVDLPESNGYQKRSRTCLEHCTWSELANVGWSFASHGSCRSVESETLLVGVAREARQRLKAGGLLNQGVLVRDIAQLVWALGTLQADNFRLADDLVYLVEALSNYLRLDKRSTGFNRGRPLRRWSCADLVQVALSLAHARIDEIPLLRAIYEESNYRLAEGFEDQRRPFQAWEVSVLLWAQARLYLTEAQGPDFDEFTCDAVKFLSKTLSESSESLESIGVGQQEQANTVWSLTVLEKHRSPEAVALINRIFQEAAEACKDKLTIQLEHAHQLWQAFFLLEEESPEAVENVPVWFSDYLKEKWTAEKAREKLSSARHRSLSQTLKLMGVDHYNEHDEDIDVAIVLKGNAVWTHETEKDEDFSSRVSVAVEFDGPMHFTREREVDSRSVKPRALGHTVLKYRLLKKQGWSVVRVPYYEFDKIPFWASMERQRYLQRKLKTHANIKFSESDVSEYKVITPNRKSRFD